MKAIHVNWTAPFFHRNRLRGHGFGITRGLKGQCYNQPDYQIFYTILSAHYWKLHNGPIKLYTDTVGLEFYRQFYMHELYDNIDIRFLNNYTKSKIDPALFWTSGKIRSLANMVVEMEPFVFLDQDLIIRSTIPEHYYDKDILITHWEIPGGFYYFTEEDWKKDIKHIKLPDNLSLKDWSPNTSFLYFKDPDIIKKYDAWHKKLVDNRGNLVPEWFWLFTDQGILGHIIRENDYNVDSLTDRIFYADNNSGDINTRYKGICETWYYPMGSDFTKDEHIKWEHVWLRKNAYAFQPEVLKKETQEFFNECVELGLTKYLYFSRFQKYWDEYSKNH